MAAQSTVLSRRGSRSKPAPQRGGTDAGNSKGNRRRPAAPKARTQPVGGETKPIGLESVPLGTPATALVLPRLGDVPRWITSKVNDEPAARLARALLDGGILRESDWCGSVQESVSKGLVRWAGEKLGGRKLVCFEEPTLGWVMKADLDRSLGLRSHYHTTDPTFGGFYIEGADYGRTFYLGHMIDAMNEFFDGVGDLVYVYFESLLWFEYVDMEYAYERIYEDYEMDCTGDETDQELEDLGRISPDWLAAIVPEIFWNTYTVGPRVSRSNLERLKQSLGYIEDGVEPVNEFLGRTQKILRRLIDIHTYLDSPRISRLRSNEHPGNALGGHEDNGCAAAFQLAYKYPNPAEQIFMWHRDCCLEDGSSLGIAFQPFRDNDPDSIVLAAKRTGVFLKLMAAVDEILELLHTSPQDQRVQTQVQVRCTV